LQPREEELLRSFVSRLPLRNVSMADKLKTLQDFILKYKNADGTEFSEGDLRLLRQILTQPFGSDTTGLGLGLGNGLNGVQPIIPVPVLQPPAGGGAGIGASPQLQQILDALAALPQSQPQAQIQQPPQPQVAPQQPQGQLAGFQNINYADLNSYTMVPDVATNISNIAWPRNGQPQQANDTYHLVYFTIAGANGLPPSTYIVPLISLALVSRYVEVNLNAIQAGAFGFADFGVFRDQFSVFPVRVPGEVLVNPAQKNILQQAISRKESYMPGAVALA
jgi:hypothetical protein